MKSIYVILFAFALLSVVSCKKETQPDSDTPVTPVGSTVLHSGTIINKKVVGLVTDSNGLPVADAQVSIGNQVTYTNNIGIFSFASVSLDQQRAFAKVKKSGFFTSGRSFRPVNSEMIELNIVLLPKTVVGTFNSNSGGTISVGNNASLQFEPGDISLGNGSAYSGNVTVFAQYLDPMADETLDRMPGDLVGINSQDAGVGLETFGMIAVELIGANGEELNVTPGQTVGLTMNVQPMQLTNAPSSIPLWYFEEFNGHWVEDGNATLNGSAYEGEVGHFTFWNCDYPEPLLDFEVTIVCNGVPVIGIEATLTIPGSSPRGGSYSDGQGKIYGAIPANREFVLTLTDRCGNDFYQQNIGPFTSDVNLGELDQCANLPSSSLISCTVLDCNNNPIPNGAIEFTYDGYTDHLFTNSSGEINSFYTYCVTPTSNVEVTAYNLDQGNQSNPQSLPFSSNMDFGDIPTCNQADEFVNFTVDGVDYGIIEVISNEIIVGEVSLNPTLYQFVASYNGIELKFLFEDVTAPGTYPNQDWAFPTGFSPLNIYTPTSNIDASANSIDITFSNVALTTGDYFEGSFGGTFNDLQGNPHTLSGTFKAKRQ
ncbi:MAG: carboxypeptidase-like regulatory domain-containing protein [bacterium]|nr:carboxypeptidase-like regulatory domain-containing protein [bacterium]